VRYWFAKSLGNVGGILRCLMSGNPGYRLVRPGVGLYVDTTARFSSQLLSVVNTQTIC